MNIRERMDTFFSGERPDQIPFTIYQNEWRHTASDPTWQNLFKLGMGVTWHIPPFQEKLDSQIKFESLQYTEEGKNIVRNIYKSPIGDIVESFVDDWQTEYFLKTAQDYRVFTYMVRHTQISPDYENWHRKEQKIGPYGIPLVALGRSPNQTMLVDLVGVENYAFHSIDLDTEFMELYDALLTNFQRKIQLAAEGPGRFVSVLENFSADTLGPNRFKKMLLPVYQDLFPVLQAAGKIVGTHFDGRIASCRKYIDQAPIDLIESLTPPPEGDMSLTDCRSAWPEKLFWSNLNVECYLLPENELHDLVLDRVSQASQDGRKLAFEVSEQYPENWQTTLPVVLKALQETKHI